MISSPMIFLKQEGARNFQQIAIAQVGQIGARNKKFYLLLRSLISRPEIKGKVEIEIAVGLSVPVVTR